MISPAPDKIKQARDSAGLTQAQAADLVHVLTRAWQRWEAGDRQMPAAHWELFCIKTGVNE